MMRSTYWDSIKGWSIIAVIVIHASGNSYTSFTEGSANWVFGITLRQFVNFAVPLFLTLAGLFSRPKVGVTPILFIFSRCLRLIPPYLLWSVAYLMFSKSSHFLDPQLLLTDIFMGKGIGVGYFVIVLLQFIFLTPFIWRIKSIKTHMITMIAFTAIGLFSTYTLRTIFIDHPFGKFPLNAIFFIYWYPFFHFGVFVSLFKEKVIEWVCGVKKVIYFLVPLFVMLSLIEGFFWANHGFISLGTSQMKASSFILSFLSFLSLLYCNNRPSLLDSKVMAWLGRGSYVIYLSHMFALKHVKALLGKSEFVFENQPVFILLATSITVALCSFLLLIAEKTPVRNVGRYMGV
jgi:surface polysaccharide O-acyltransferase-like enzyme